MSSLCKKSRLIDVTLLAALLMFTLLFIPDTGKYFLHLDVTKKAAVKHKNAPKGQRPLTSDLCTCRTGDDDLQLKFIESIRRDEWWVKKLWTWFYRLVVNICLGQYLWYWKCSDQIPSFFSLATLPGTTPLMPPAFLIAESDLFGSAKCLKSWKVLTQNRLLI